MSSQGGREIEAARKRLAAAKKHASSAAKISDSTKEAEEIAIKAAESGTNGNTNNKEQTTRTPLFAPI